MEPERNPRDAPLKEVGWLVTVDHTSRSHLESRVGWGQKRVHADETSESFDRPAGQTVFMDKSLTDHMIVPEIQVRWRSFDDDMEACYDGVLSIHWLFDDDDLAYNIDRFNMHDAGAVHVFYSVEDIISIADYLKMPRWRDFILGHKDMTYLGTDQGRWAEIYG